MMTFKNKNWSNFCRKKLYMDLITVVLPIPDSNPFHLDDVAQYLLQAISNSCHLAVSTACLRTTNYRNRIFITMDALDLEDIYRKRHPKLNKYSYTSKALNVESRIDYFLVSRNLSKFVKKVDIKPSIAPDHNALSLTLSWSKVESRGPGFWKFNNELLMDETFVEKI